MEFFIFYATGDSLQVREIITWQARDKTLKGIHYFKPLDDM